MTTGASAFSDDHMAFAQEAVALARKHGATGIDMTFRLSGSRRFFENTGNWQQVRMHWSEGRHGDASEITLTGEARVSFAEARVGGET